jgi:dethiobiotin synthetase
VDVRRIIFITGTGTGVGKTLLTALLLRHLRMEGHDALAMKPFCSGSRQDARLLQRLQKEDLTLDQTNPFFFSRPLAPWVAVRENGGRQIPLSEVLRRIQALRRLGKILLVEGSGGVLVPLGEGYGVADLISRIPCATIIVAPNRLGTINHVLLTVKHLQSIEVKEVKIVMMSERSPDFSSRSNINAISELLPETGVFSLPYLGGRALNVAMVKQNAKYLKITLARILGGGSL